MMRRLLISLVLLVLIVGFAKPAPGRVEAQTVPPSFQVDVLATGFAYPHGIAFNSGGDLFVSDNSAHTIYRVTPAGVKSAFVTTSWPDPLAFDASGNLYVGNTGGGAYSWYEPGTVSKITPSGEISVFANIVDADGLAFDGAGNLFVAAGRVDHAVLKVTPGGTITTFASTLPNCGNPYKIAFNSQRDLFVACGSFGVLKIDPTGAVSIFATGIGSPIDFALGSDDTLFVGDFGGTIYRCTPSAQCDVFATGFQGIIGVAFDPTGTLHVSQRTAGNVVKVVALRDHFLSYDVNESKGTSKFERLTVSLADQFGAGTFEVKKPKRLFNPADKNGEGIHNSDTHLVGYEITQTTGEPKHIKKTDILVENQFGQLFVDINKPDRLLVPSLKNLDEAIDDGELPDEFPVDHFKCYTIKVSKGTPKFEPSQVTLADQFGTSLYDIKKPNGLCNPVDKLGEGIQNLYSHLLCYDVKLAKGEPSHEKVQGIHINSQLGQLQLDTKKAKELCVPSRINVP